MALAMMVGLEVTPRMPWATRRRNRPLVRSPRVRLSSQGSGRTARGAGAAWSLGAPCRQRAGLLAGHLVEGDAGIGQPLGGDRPAVADQRLDGLCNVPDVGVHASHDPPVLEPEGEE